ncbi:MAG: DUF1549 domain-containing protein [Isosphaeraceae bacterium]
MKNPAMARPAVVLLMVAAPLALALGAPPDDPPPSGNASKTAAIVRPPGKGAPAKAKAAQAAKKKAAVVKVADTKPKDPAASPDKKKGQEKPAPAPFDAAKYGRPGRVVEKPTLTAAQIDTRIDALLAESGVKPVELTTDDEFIHRATLDLIGNLPSPPEIARFRTFKGGNKRARLIEDLLASPKFGENWAAYWRDVVVTRATNQNPGRLEGYKDFETWLAAQLNQNRPWDEIATAAITATGKFDDNGAAGLMLAHVDGGKVVEAEIAGEVSRIFLGIQIQCAQCHDHPTDQWKREQFHGFAAFFAGIRGKVNQETAQIDNAPRAGYGMPDLKDPTKKTPVDPRFFLETSAASSIPKTLNVDQRRALAASFVTGQDNPWFSRAFVNRVWTLLIGEGFYTPIDDLGPGREAKASAILDEVADQWSRGGYDVKWLFRTLMATKAYQRRIRSTYSEAGRTTFAANTVSRLRGEQIVDALEDAIGAKLGPQNGRAMLRGPRALFHSDPSSPTDEVQGTIPQALFLMNAPAVQGAIVGKNSLAAQVLRNAPNDLVAMDAIYLRILCRHPTKAEAKVFDTFLRGSKTRQEAYEDLVWALVNSAEFQCRH